MKFAHEYRSVLETEEFPAQWVAYAVPYRQLKKCLKKVRSFSLLTAQLELQDVGVNLSVPKQTSYSRNKKLLCTGEPTIVDRKNQTHNNNKTSAPNNYIHFHPQKVDTENDITQSTINNLQSYVNSRDEKSSLTKYRAREDLSLEQEISPLIVNVEFFNILKKDVALLELLQSQEQESLGNQIEALSTAITNLAKPSKFRKTDMYRWRELFEIYLRAGVFFSNNELDCGIRDSKKAAKQLTWFQSELSRRGLGNMFKLSASRDALEHFVAINISLLHLLKFQEINQKAISKILKSMSGLLFNSKLPTESYQKEKKPRFNLFVLYITEEITSVKIFMKSNKKLLARNHLDASIKSSKIQNEEKLT
ncbi:putative RING finger protein C6B12.07c [Golovinomyces cichoracearum]|uniref:Putative RING finger protein C6B12.07c n=1 Tax=Golovinomyces cichoracearum TaxID=62708 RepID=A0A420HU55_9PEZI|nr:putative RING finger protein C6B12.07c [Golovinomyces cichoracearum]